MESFLISLTTVAVAEMGDRTQLLSLLLAAKFRKPLPIIAGIFFATLANHAAAGFIGVWFGHYLTPSLLDGVVGVSLIVMALWVLKPDTLNENEEISGRSAFFATLGAFFVAEIGDKTQIATIALAAAYRNLPAVIAGTTSGMMLANIPVVFLGDGFAKRLPLRAIRFACSALFVAIGIVFLLRAFWR